jgi:hypothetical protein
MQSGGFNTFCGAWMITTACVNHGIERPAKPHKRDVAQTFRLTEFTPQLRKIKP